MAEQFTGCVDGYQNGAIYGWAVDRSKGEGYVFVTAWVDGVEIGCTMTRHHRPDVQAALGVPAMSGFYLDLSNMGLPKWEIEVELRLPDGAALEQSPIRVRPEPAGRWQGRPTVAFMHIVKTAGTALRNAVSQNFRPSETAMLYWDPPGIAESDVKLMPARERAELKLVFGHFPYGIHRDLVAPYTYATFVRHPIARVISYYHHAIRMNMPHAFEGERRLTLPEMLEAGTNADMDNTMVRKFAGLQDWDLPCGGVTRDIYELAVENAGREFSFIGFQEHAEQDFPALFKFFGWDEPHAGWAVERANDGGYTSSLDERAEWVKAIVKFDAWDLLLYERLLKDRGERGRASG